MGYFTELSYDIIDRFAKEFNKYFILEFNRKKSGPFLLVFKIINSNFPIEDNFAKLCKTNPAFSMMYLILINMKKELFNSKTDVKFRYSHITQVPTPKQLNKEKINKLIETSIVPIEFLEYPNFLRLFGYRISINDEKKSIQKILNQEKFEEKIEELNRYIFGIKKLIQTKRKIELKARTKMFMLQSSDSLSQLKEKLKYASYSKIDLIDRPKKVEISNDGYLVSHKKITNVFYFSELSEFSLIPYRAGAFFLEPSDESVDLHAILGASKTTKINFETILKVDAEYMNRFDLGFIVRLKDNSVVGILDSRILLNGQLNKNEAERVLFAYDGGDFYYELHGDVIIFDPQLLTDSTITQLKKIATSGDSIIINNLQKWSTIPKDRYKPEILKKLLKNGFRGKPKEHQKIGISWLYQLYESGAPGAILADDMGMGKTFQSIGFLAAVNATRLSILIVAPASVVGVWHNELKQFYPKLLKNIRNGKLSIVSYESINKALNSSWDIIILDEVQKVKNRKSQTFSLIRKLDYNFVLELSGTVIENSVDDLINIIELISEDLRLKIVNIRRILGKNDQLKTVTYLKKFISPLFLMRKKDTSIVTAKLNIHNVYVKITTVEKKVQHEIHRFYRTEFNKLLKIRKKSDINFMFYASQQVLQSLLKMRQALSDLQSFIKNKDSASILTNQTVIECAKVTRTSKTKKLIEIYKSLKKSGRKVVVFVMFRSTLNTLKDILEKEGARVLTLSGEDSKQLRTTTIENFQKGEADIFIASLKAANFGITLHKANALVIYDLWYNPAVIAQAIARVHRIGQTDDVDIFILIAKHTVDERIAEIFLKKQEIIRAFESPESLKNNEFDQNRLLRFGEQYLKDQKL